MTKNDNENDITPEGNGKETLDVKKWQKNLVEEVGKVVEEKLPKIKHKLTYEEQGGFYEFTYTPSGTKVQPETFIINTTYLFDNDKPNDLWKYIQLRFVKEESLFHHTLGKIKSFFYGKPYNIHEKLQAMELVTSLFDENGKLKDEMPKKFVGMDSKDFERVLGALNNGRLKTAVNNYLYKNTKKLKGSNPDKTLANVDDIIKM